MQLELEIDHLTFQSADSRVRVGPSEPVHAAIFPGKGQTRVLLLRPGSFAWNVIDHKTRFQACGIGLFLKDNVKLIQLVFLMEAKL